MRRNARFPAVAPRYNERAASRQQDINNSLCRGRSGVLLPTSADESSSKRFRLIWYYQVFIINIL